MVAGLRLGEVAWLDGVLVPGAREVISGQIVAQTKAGQAKECDSDCKWKCPGRESLLRLASIQTECSEEHEVENHFQKQILDTKSALMIR